MLTHLRIHLLLVVLSGTTKMHLNILLFKRTVIKANRNSNLQQTEICCGYPFLPWYGKGGTRCYLSNIRRLDVLRCVLERACKNWRRMQWDKVKKEEAAAHLLNLLLSLISPNDATYGSTCPAVCLQTSQTRFTAGCKASAVCRAAPLGGGKYCTGHTC